MIDLSTRQGILMFPFMVGFGYTAFLWLFRLLRTCLTGKAKRYNHHALWIFPVLLILVCGVYPHGYFPITWVLWMFAGWLFAILCAIIQKKISIKKSWKWILEETMRRIVGTIDDMKSSLLSINKKWTNLSRWKQALWVLAIIGIGAFSILINQDTACFVATGWWVVFSIWAMCRHTHSCKSLVFFWFTYAIVGAVLLACMLGDYLPNGIANDVVVYCFICVVLTGFWCVSAIVSDFDAAKLAGTIVNTTTTILLLGINIFFATLQKRFDIIESSSYDAAVYIVNIVLFPVVAAGYLAVLSVDIIQYYRKRCPGEEE